MPSQEKAVTKAMRRHQRDGRRFRDLLVHCACGWKSPALKARKGSNDFALAREDQAKSFERHVARALLAATVTPESAGLLARLSASGGRNIDLLKRAKDAEAKVTAAHDLHKAVQTDCTNLDGSKFTGWICNECTPTGWVSELTLYPCPTITALEGTK